MMLYQHTDAAGKCRSSASLYASELAFLLTSTFCNVTQHCIIQFSQCTKHIFSVLFIMLRLVAESPVSSG